MNLCLDVGIDIDVMIIGSLFDQIVTIFIDMCHVSYDDLSLTTTSEYVNIARIFKANAKSIFDLCRFQQHEFKVCNVLYRSIVLRADNGGRYEKFIKRSSRK